MRKLVTLMLLVFATALRAPVPTTTAFAVSVRTPSYGASVTFTATVLGDSPAGTVTFIGDTYWTLGTCTLFRASCTFSLANLIPGPQSIVARYSGDDANLPSTSDHVELRIGPRIPITSMVTLDASSTAIPHGTSTVLTARVSPGAATGTVTFRDGSATLGTSPVIPSARDGISASLFGLTTSWIYLKPPINYHTVRSWSMQPSVSWAAVNPSENRYNWNYLDAWVIANAGKDMIYDLGGTPQWASLYPHNDSGGCSPPSSITYWDKYLEAVASRYPQIHYWEIWNEPQDTRSWCGPTVGSAGPIATMAIMSQHAASIIKKINPSAQILAPATTSWYPGGLAPKWMTSFMETGGTFDIFAFHGYIANPGIAEDEAGIVNSIRSVMGAAGISKPLWNTEAGWYTESQHVLATARQPGFLAKMYIIQQSLGVARFVWYEYQEGAQWGEMFNPATGDNANVPTYNAVYNWLVGATLSRPCSVTSSVETCGYTRPGGYVAQAVWETNPSGLTYSYAYPKVMTRYVDLTGTVHLTAGGTVLIGDAPILLESGDIPAYSATLSSAALPIGTHAITATYGGDTYYATSTSSPTLVTVSQRIDK